MMRLIIGASLLLISLEATGAIIEPSLIPDHFEDIGKMHTEAFNALGKMYTTKRPTRKMVMMRDIHNIVGSFCKVDDDACRSYVKDETNRRELLGDYREISHDAIEYPIDFDAELLRSIENVYSTLQLLSPSRGIKQNKSDNMKHVDEVLERLAQIQREMKDSYMHVDELGIIDYHVKPLHLMAALSGISVAIESTKLWTAVYKDGAHPLFGLHHPSYYRAAKEDHHVRGRRTQVTRYRDSSRKALDYEFDRLGDDWDYDYDWHDEHHSDDFNYTAWQLPVNILVESPCLDFLDGDDGNDGNDDEEIGCVGFLVSLFDPVGAVSADFSGAIYGGLELIQSEPELVLTPLAIIARTLFSAVSSSATWLLDPPTPAPVTPNPTASPV